MASLFVAAVVAFVWGPDAWRNIRARHIARIESRYLDLEIKGALE